MLHPKFIACAALIVAAPTFAQDATTPFQIQNRGKVSRSAADIARLQGEATPGEVSADKKTLTFHEPVVRLVITTGPEDDMLSYRINGLRNPTLIVPANAILNVSFVNTDGDMFHDIHFGTTQLPFPIAPDVNNAPGTSKIPHGENERFYGEDLTIRASAVGSFVYFCSVRGHAKSGMFGTIAVGTAPAAPPTSPAPDAGMGGMKMDGMSHDHDMKGMDMSHDMKGMDMGAMAMHSSVDLLDPMSRESSGTSWVPDSSPLYAKMKMRGDTMLMVHGSILPRYTRIGSKRETSSGSRNRFDAPSMFMGMASKPVGKNAQVGARLMLSLDPIIERGYGYPLLYQSGESFRGQPIHDRQHPHDLVSELSATYSQRVGKTNSLSLYLGYPGEPALGPPAFMHRLSAMDNPDAPLSHHWQDSTHITFGVATLGFSTGRLKLEGSAFKGEEPNENRYNFDSLRLDSASTRLSWNPTRDLALQVSYGSLRRPEPAEPEVTSRQRTTASIIYNRPLGSDANWSNSFVFGRNNDSNGVRSNSFLVETNLQRRSNTIYARAERVQKSGHELVLPSVDGDRLFPVSSYALGFVRDLKHGKGLDVGLGAQVTFGQNPSSLSSIYGGRSHTGFQVFLRVRPSRLKMN